MIRRGEPWGLPYDGRAVVWAGSDRELASAGASAPARPERACIALTGGDIFRTLGGGGSGGGPAGEQPAHLPVGDLQIVPIDLIRVRLDGSTTVTGAAHIVVGRLQRGVPTWWGRTRAICNADFIGSANVAPGGHPNDGRVTVLDAHVTGRQWWLLRSRLEWGGHLPHPAIASSSASHGSLDLGRRAAVVVDGHVVGRASRLDFEVVDDAVDVVVVPRALLPRAPR